MESLREPKRKSPLIALENHRKPWVPRQGPREHQRERERERERLREP